MSTGTSPEQNRPDFPLEQPPSAGDVAPHLGATSVTAAKINVSPVSANIAIQERPDEPPTYGAAAIQYYERTSGIRWQPLELTLQGIPWPKGDERAGTGDRAVTGCDLLNYRKAVEAANRQAESGGGVPARSNEVDAFRKALREVVDHQGRKVGEAAEAILGEQIANYMQRVHDRDPRPFVVLQDPATGALRIDYYSFEEVIPRTFAYLEGTMNTPRRTKEEILGHAAAGNISDDKKTGRGESGRGLPIAEDSSTAWGIEHIFPKAGREHDGAHIVYVITGDKLDAQPPEPIVTAKLSDADAFLAAWEDVADNEAGTSTPVRRGALGRFVRALAGRRGDRGGRWRRRG